MSYSTIQLGVVDKCHDAIETHHITLYIIQYCYISHYSLNDVSLDVLVDDKHCNLFLL